MFPAALLFRRVRTPISSPVRPRLFWGPSEFFYAFIQFPPRPLNHGGGSQQIPYISKLNGTTPVREMCSIDDDEVEVHR